MAWLLQAPELWIGLGLFLAAAFFLLGGKSDERKLRERATRIATKQPRTLTRAQDSLRRREPEAGGALAQSLSGLGFMGTLRGKLILAGMQSTSPERFTLIMGFSFLGTAAVLLFLGKPPLLALLAGVIAGLGIPSRLVTRRIRKRQRMILTQLPDAIDLIVRGLRAGLPVSESFQTVSREIPDPLGGMFGVISQQIGLGVPMEKALSDTAAMLSMTEFNFFVTTIILQRETGGNLGEILSNLAEVLRQRRMMKLKIHAISSEARASAYIVGALPFVVYGLLTVIAPDYLRPLYEDYRGNYALIGAACSMGLGAFVMRRMTQFEI